ncbi:methionine--tRNA ligase, cytoplasmic isoform X2 [Planococcus citri]|uniref:methionine--tRNA ligase, cytoplasmic isoform X2 n=1 Tax=Planococcus citri TaxID=170843 RepID=UPI0031FA0A2B
MLIQVQREEEGAYRSFCTVILSTATMKCFTNPSNPGALKLLIASKCGQKEIQIDTVNAKDQKSHGFKRLPVLELDNGTKIFSSTAGARYLFKPDDNLSEKVDVWLTWESTVLLPALAACNLDKISDSPVLNAVSFIDEAVKNKVYLVDERLTVADVVLWSSLFALFTEQNIVSQYLSSKHSILNWFNNLKDSKPFKESIAIWGQKQGNEVFKSFVEGCSYPSVGNMENVTVTEEKETVVTEAEINEAEQAWLGKRSSRPKPRKFTKPVLPQAGEKNILITSALPYVNNVPHLGNIIGCVLSADVFARYCKLRNWNALYIAGTDEYGTATETKALEEKLTPRQICDKYFEIHKETYTWFNIDFDYFGRTTTDLQTTIAQDLFLRIHKKGYTSTASVEQLFCQNCSRFLADRFVEGTCPKCKYEDARGDQCDGCGTLINAVELIQPRCKVCGKMPVVQNSNQLFLELPKIEPVLQEWIKSSCDHWSHNAREITNSWLKDGLKARCITRDLKWGVPVPLSGFEKKVFYVWFDAPIGYMSITANYSDEWRKWWQPAKETPVTLYQFMAKDNVPFHSVMFPATLLAVGENYQLVNHIFATEYLNYEDGKFSKSRGIGVFGTDAKNTGIPADIFRFYLLYMRPESHDSSFSWVDLATKHNTELLNNIGNFVNRALVFDEKFFNSVIPPMNMVKEDYVLLASVTREIRGYHSVLENGKLRDGIKYMLNISRHGNIYMQTLKPWVLIKGNDEEKKRAATVIGILCNVAALLAIVIRPYMPNIAKIMAEQMNASEDLFVLTEDMNILLPEGHKIGKPVPIFTKIELSTVETLKKMFSGRQTSPPKEPSKKPEETFADLQSASKVADSLKKMENAITEQGNLVRNMKSGGAQKAEWQPHVNALLDMKKQYEELKKVQASLANNVSPASTEEPVKNGECQDKEQEIIRLEEGIKTLGDKIRTSKTNKESKEVWGPFLTEMLDLKNKLAQLKPSAEPAAPSKKGKKKS